MRRCEPSHCTPIRSTATGTMSCGRGQVDYSISIKGLTSSFANTAHWFGAGTANVSWTAPATFGASSFFVTDFDVTSPVNFAFTGTLAASNSCCANADLADASASLSVFTGVDEDGDPLFIPRFNFR